MTKTNNYSEVIDSQSLMQVAKHSCICYSSATKAVLITPYKNLKKVALSGSYKIIGCSCDQFATDTVAAIDYVTNFIGNTYIVVKQNKTTRTNYFNFSNVKDAEIFLNAAIVYDDKLVDLYKKVKLEEGTQIITIQSFKKVNIINLLDKIKNLFTPHSKIVDRNTSIRTKISFKKSNEEFEIPSFLKLDNELVAITYKESKSDQNCGGNALLIALKNNIDLQIFELKVSNSSGSHCNGLKVGRMINQSYIDNLTIVEMHGNTLTNNNRFTILTDITNDLDTLCVNTIDSFIKNKCGKSAYETVEEPILDNNGNIITSPDAKLNVWAKHFGNLVDNTTYNKVIIALKATPNKKAAWIDPIPIVDSAPRKDNLKYPNNYRGISSISTIVK
ncbi:hypothetical protein BB561_001666 [Smittium simulii]|uniref:Uncharacterized protein n=1 Tax=Smittium simulii TaxID=133385 RepID=A0A2T9YTN9_9FUNG|nr:hypothetical protein BB561_001666 [Smittium simulii]